MTTVAISCEKEPRRKSFNSDSEDSLENFSENDSLVEVSPSSFSSVNSSDNKLKNKRKSTRTSGSYDVTVSSNRLSADLYSSANSKKSPSPEIVYESGTESDISYGESFYSVNTDLSDRVFNRQEQGVPELTSVNSLSTEFYSAETLFDSTQRSRSNSNLRSEGFGSQDSLVTPHETPKLSRAAKSTSTISEWFESSPYFNDLNETPCISCPNIYSADSDKYRSAIAFESSRSYTNINTDSQTIYPSYSTQTLTSKSEFIMNGNDEAPTTPITPVPSLDDEPDKKPKSGLISSFRKSRKTTQKIKAEKAAEDEENESQADGDEKFKDANADPQSPLPDENGTNPLDLQNDVDSSSSKKKSKIKSPKVSRKVPKSPKTPKSAKKIKDKLKKENSFIDLDLTDKESDQPEKSEKDEKSEREEKEEKKKKKGGFLSKKDKKSKSDEATDSSSKDNQSIEDVQSVNSEDPLTANTNEKESNNSKPKKHLFKRSKSKLESPPPTLDITNEAGQSSDKREHLYKILVIGELGTGKTSIIKRYVHQFFSQHYRATIGVDFALKVLNWDANTIIRLQLWDIAGQERFGNMTRVYYKEAVGAFVVFDVTRSQTFDAITKWKTDLDTKVTLPDGSPIPAVMLANKCDQPKEGVVNNPSRMDDFCRERGFSGWFETSAKENINIDEAARFLVNKILINEKQGLMLNDSLDPEKFSLEGRSSQGGGCAC